MSFYSFFQYLKYSWRARGRHGIHSPFVYSLVDNVLSKKGTVEKKLNKILEDKTVHFISGNSSGWMRQFKNITPSLVDNTVIIFSGIYDTPETANTWQKVTQEEQVSLSIDLYHYGLCFFKKEFQEKQHFILKH